MIIKKLIIFMLLLLYSDVTNAFGFKKRTSKINPEKINLNTVTQQIYIFKTLENILVNITKDSREIYLIHLCQMLKYLRDNLENKTFYKTALSYANENKYDSLKNFLQKLADSRNKKIPIIEIALQLISQK